MEVVRHEGKAKEPDLEALPGSTELPSTISLSSWLGRRRYLPWIVRQVTSTRAPPSGMKRSRLDMPKKDGKRRKNRSLS